MISAKIIADSVNIYGNRLTTFELEYPRFIHSELMTHRVFSRNAASSRAIPVKRMIKTIKENPAKPLHWGQNQSGMQAEKELTPDNRLKAEILWNKGLDSAIEVAEALADVGVHKQIVNRVLEPFQIMKTIVSATEYGNFFWLRRHADAQPEIQVLAEEMFTALEESTPSNLYEGEYHTPYVDSYRIVDSTIELIKHPLEGEDEIATVDIKAFNPSFRQPLVYTSFGRFLTVDQAKMLSAASCAQVSYRCLDQSIDKTKKIHEMLVGDGESPVHASAFEHVATPVGELSGSEISNFIGWAQYRKQIKGETR